MTDPMTTGKAERTPFRWVFWTKEATLKACPLCGEKTIERVDTYSTSAPAGGNAHACRLFFKCGHMFGARAIDRKLFEAKPDFFSEFDKKPPR